MTTTDSGPPTSWRDLAPWQGKATRLDKALLIAIIALIGYGFAMMPLKPFLIASHPVLLEFMTGGYASIGAAAAFARIGEFPLWQVIFAGVVGMIKFDWLFWWTGRQWGRGIIKLFANGERAKRLAGRAHDLNPWLVRSAVVLAMLPGIPSALVFAIAGWTGMRLLTFLLLDALGALLITSLVAGLGFQLGQWAVDIVLTVDKYALWVSLAVIIGISIITGVKQSRRQAKSQDAGVVPEPAPDDLGSTSVLTIRRDLVDDIIAHAKQDHPDEACGVITGPEGSDDPVRLVRMTNAARSPTFFEFDSTEHKQLANELFEQDHEIVVVYHSHTATEAYPSRTDISLAAEPQAHYLLVSTAESGNGDGPVEVRSYRILDGVVTEEEIAFRE
ncbi:Mov34/MPN/PAD-1 family protein [Microlunatus sp. GCM10028923]|uniref:Mov34/MPN/PAD-1 family protein n=1 Tax=Microlunatus sp. GCM10028923 TaxID=3273400 RepID=UPI0036117588